MTIIEEKMELWEETQEKELTRWLEEIMGFYLSGTIQWALERHPGEWRRYNQLEDLLLRACLKKNGSVVRQAVDKCVSQMMKIVELYKQSKKGDGDVRGRVQEGGEEGVGQEGNPLV